MLFFHHLSQDSTTARRILHLPPELLPSPLITQRPPYPYNQPPSQQCPIPGHGGHEKDRERDHLERWLEVPSRGLVILGASESRVSLVVLSRAIGLGVIPAEERVPTVKEA